MKIKNIKISADHIVLLLYFSLFFFMGLSLLFTQPFGSPPDEYNRFLIPAYIAENGTIPSGYEEAIRIPGYGFSYGFQPILPYMFQGYAMRFAKLFTSSKDVLLYTARMVNFLFGLVTAIFVLLLGKEWFPDKRFARVFAFLAAFLPQSIFLHTYVNTDSCCMMSIAIILYALTKGIKTNFSTASCSLLSVGIIFCALSYYNAYGYILSSILLFTASFLSCSKKTDSAGKRKFSFHLKPFLQKGLFISAIVLLGIGWWFIRSFILYDGDILGLKSRDLCGAIYALPEFHPDTRVTWQSQGFSLWEMLTRSDFVQLTLLSFIGIYGPMTITTSIWVYRFYRLFFGLSLFCCIFPVKFYAGKLPQNATLTTPAFLAEHSLGFRIFFHCNMVFCMAMPCFLSLYYSYTTDYQPQGRYVLPILLPFLYYCVQGFEKALAALTRLLAKKKPAKKSSDNICIIVRNFSTGICVLLTAGVILSLAVTVYGYALPYYALHPIAP